MAAMAIWVFRAMKNTGPAGPQFLGKGLQRKILLAGPEKAFQRAATQVEILFYSFQGFSHGNENFYFKSLPCVCGFDECQG
jgi:hypothetical protein